MGRARGLGAEALHVPRLAITRSRCERWRAAGLAVRVYTVDDPADQRRLLEWGVDGIFTNVPAQLRELLG